MVTLKDIAAEAGVSITTVSNVVHNRKSRVSEKKVAKIWEIIEREHYVPSMSARSLANDQSAIIAMVTYITPRTTGSTVSDPFMSSVAASVEQRTREAGYYLMLRSAESVAALEGLIHSWRLSGLIMTGLFQDSFFDAVAKLVRPDACLFAGNFRAGGQKAGTSAQHASRNHGDFRLGGYSGGRHHVRAARVRGKCAAR